MSAAVPRVARVHITTADNDAARPGLYRSIADADAMLADAVAENPPPEGRPYQALTFSVIWSDGFRIDDRLYVTRQFVVDAADDGGVLRHGLLRMARAQADGAAYRGLPPDRVEALKARGRDLLRRLELDVQGLDWPRNATAPSGRGPTLLPSPGDAIWRLKERFSFRRRLVPVDAGSSPYSAAYPATNHADVRYLTNFISLALGNDLSTFEPSTAAAMWNHWRLVVQAVQRSLRSDDDSEPYPGNEQLWRKQLPALIRLLEEAVASGGTLRNGRLAFRQVGNRDESYPDWVQALRGKSGVYVIRERQRDGSAPIVYVGESHTDRLHETLTRHFQAWRRWKGFWRGQFAEGHDPGLTYDRDAAEAAVVITPPHHALEMEARLIRRLRPRDNLIGQADEHVPF